MKNYDNIEKHPFKNGYIGYTADGYARQVLCNGSRPFKWVAYPHIGEPLSAKCVNAKTLGDMSLALSKLNSLKEG